MFNFRHNRRKLDELPYQYYQLNPTSLENSEYLNDLNWIYAKICGSNSFQLLEDIYLSQVGHSTKSQNRFVELLKDFMEKNASLLNYDGRQFYGHLYNYLENTIDGHETDTKILKVLKISKDPPVLTLINLSNKLIDKKLESKGSKHSFLNNSFDLVTRLPETEQFVVTVSTNEEEICVWDIKK